jgi:hypothetical protein
MSKLLEMLNDPRNEALLRRQMRSGFEAATTALFPGLGEDRERQKNSELAAALDDSDPQRRLSALETIAKTEAPGTDAQLLSSVIRRVFDESHPVRVLARRLAASDALGFLRGPLRHAVLSALGSVSPQAMVLIPAHGANLTPIAIAHGAIDNGQITWVMHTDSTTGDVELRFGAHGRERENAVIALSMEPGSDSSEPATDHEVWLRLLILEPRGTNRLGARVVIPHSELRPDWVFNARVLN